MHVHRLASRLHLDSRRSDGSARTLGCANRPPTSPHVERSPLTAYLAPQQPPTPTRAACLVHLGVKLTFVQERQVNAA